MDRMFFELPKGDLVYEQADRLFDLYDSISDSVREYVTRTNMLRYIPPTGEQISQIVSAIHKNHKEFSIPWLCYTVFSVLYMWDNEPDPRWPDKERDTNAMDRMLLSSTSVVYNNNILAIDGIVNWLVPVYGEGYDLLLPRTNYEVSIHRSNQDKETFYISIGDPPTRDVQIELTPIFPQIA